MAEIKLELQKAAKPRPGVLKQGSSSEGSSILDVCSLDIRSPPDRLREIKT